MPCQGRQHPKSFAVKVGLGRASQSYQMGHASSPQRMGFLCNTFGEARRNATLASGGRSEFRLIKLHGTMRLVKATRQTNDNASGRGGISGRFGNDALRLRRIRDDFAGV